MRKLMAILAAAALLAVAAPAAASGGWALTYLDPVPSRLDPGTSYTIGFWVLQHGTHPFEGDLGPTGLRLTGDDGVALDFPGTPLPEPGHYAAAVNVPEGVYRLSGVQGIFDPYPIGTLSAPGGIEINPLDPNLVEALRKPAVDYWGVIRPPGIPDLKDVPPATTRPAPVSGATGSATAGPAEAAPAVTGSPASDASGAGETGGLPAYTLLLAAAGGALLMLAGLRLPRRSREPDPPVEDGADIVSSG